MLNKTLLQTFEWHTSPSSEESHYALLHRLLPSLARIGVTALWLPPGCKANNSQGNGYDIYDLWDLGQFEQKGCTKTKWGNRQELDHLIGLAKELKVDLVFDAVLNHKQGGDRTESDIWAVEVDKQDRRYEICAPKKIEAWLHYDFPRRQSEEGMKYSSMKWGSEHFNGTDWDQAARKNAIYKLIDDPSTHPEYQSPTIPSGPRRLSRLLRRVSSQQGKQSIAPAPAPPPRRPGKGWAEDVDGENGNNDYLLFSNIDHSHPEVREDLTSWGRWMIREVGMQGFRLDAVQHISYGFTKDWIAEINAAHNDKTGQDVFIVGEVWTGDVKRILPWLDAVHSPGGPQVYAYDAPLLYNFSRISEAVRTGSRSADLRLLLRETLVLQRPEASVTLVTNHDTQKGQTCETPMAAELKALFYACILLRKDGHPCVFWGDLFGIEGPFAEKPACVVSSNASEDGKRNLLLDLITCRKHFAYGKQTDYWNERTCIGWTRAGSDDCSGLAVVLNISLKTTTKRMRIGSAGELWIDALGQVSEEVKIGDKRFGVFPCMSKSVSVFVRKTEATTNLFPVRLDTEP